MNLQIYIGALDDFKKTADQHESNKRVREKESRSVALTGRTDAVVQSLAAVGNAVVFIRVFILLLLTVHLLL